MIKLTDIDQLARLLPPSISFDAQIQAAAQALAPLLRATALAVPNLLIFGRLGEQKAGDMIASLGRLTEARGGLAPPSTELVERLAWQFHVDFRETAKTTEQLARMTLNSIPWHRIKGTPASIRAALKLFGFEDVFIEEDGEADYWATYQLGLSNIFELDQVRLIHRVAREMQPARCRLYRVYTDVWDVRPGGYDTGYYDENSYDLYSGVPLEVDGGGEVLVSFGRKYLAQWPWLVGDAQSGRIRCLGAQAQPDDDLLYDVGRYDITIEPHNSGFIRSRLRFSHFPAHEARRWFFAGNGIAVIEAVYDESVYDELNSHYEQPLMALFDTPAYDDAAYDEYDPDYRLVRIDELFERPHRAAGTEALLTGTRAFTKIDRAGYHLATTAPVFAPVSRWTGNWDGRTWRVGGAFINRGQITDDK